MKKFYLALERGPDQKSIYPLEDITTIGRRSENNITIIDSAVSRSHARISFQHDNWIVEDLGSSNGVIIDGQRVDKKILQSGDTFEIGSVTFRFIEEQALEESEHLSETIETFAEIISHRSVLRRHYRTKPEYMKLRAALLSNPMFKSLGYKELTGLEAIVNLHLFGADQLIIKEGDPGRSLYIILYGRGKVFTLDYNSREVKLAILESTHFFGEMSLLTGKPRSSSVLALEETLLGEMSYNSMRKIMVSSPQVKDVMLEYYHDRVSDSRRKRAMAGMPDRRQEPRLSERILVKLTVSPIATLPEAMLSHTYEATTSDISLSGALLEVKGPALDAFCIGCQLRLQIELPSPWGTVRSLGTVLNVIPAEHMIKLPIKFLVVPEKDRKNLEEFMYGDIHITD